MSDIDVNVRERRPEALRRGYTLRGAESACGASEVVTEMSSTAGFSLGAKPPAAASAASGTVIEARPGWRAIDFSEIWAHRELLYFLVWRDIKVRYKQTVVGAAWAILQPLCSMVIFSIVFGKFAGIPSDGAPYPIFVFACLLCWTFFSNAVSQSGSSLVNQSHLLTKIYFPRLLVPAASIGVGLIDFALNFAVFGGIMLWYRHVPGLAILLLPLMILLTVVTALGIGYIIASLTVAYRDFRIVVPFVLQAWMFASPVIYSTTLVPDQYRWAMSLNPMTGIIGGFRSALLGHPIDWAALGISALIGVSVFTFGIYNFRRTERRFADIA